MNITNYTPHGFRQRVAPIIGELAYVVLYDRTGGGDERLGQWPVERGVLPSEQPQENITALWNWLQAILGDAMELKSGKGRFRVRVYASKGMEVLDQFAIVAEPDEEDDGEGLDDDDDAGKADALLDGIPEGVDENAQDSSQSAQLVRMCLMAADRYVRLSERFTRQTMTMSASTARLNELAHNQLMEQLTASRQQSQDLLDVLVAERLEASEQLVARGERGARRLRPQRQPSPIAMEGVKYLGDIAKSLVLGGANLPPGAQKLLEHPKAKALLGDQRLLKLLEKDPAQADELFSMLEGILEQFPDDAPPVRGPASAEDDEAFDDLPDPGGSGPSPAP